MYTIEELIDNPTARAILEKAQTLFLAQGFSRVDMKDLAAASGVARSTLYRYFSSKEALAFYVSLYLFHTRPMFYHGPLPQSTGYEKLEFSLKRTIELLSLRRAEMAYFTQFDLIFSGAYPDMDVSDYYENHLKEHRPAFLDLIEEGIADGSIHALDNPKLAALSLQNTLIAMAQRILPREDHFRREQGYGIELLYSMTEQMLSYYKNTK